MGREADGKDPACKGQEEDAWVEGGGGAGREQFLKRKLPEVSDLRPRTQDKDFSFTHSWVWDEDPLHHLDLQ